jgi:hypothetical protein
MVDAAIQHQRLEAELKAVREQNKLLKEKKRVERQLAELEFRLRRPLLPEDEFRILQTENSLLKENARIDLDLQNIDAEIHRVRNSETLPERSPAQPPEETESKTPQPQTSTHSGQVVAEFARNVERLQAEAAASTMMRDALVCVQDVISQALSLAVPDRQLMIVTDHRYNVVACCRVSDAVADSLEKRRSISERSEEVGLSVEFAKLEGRTLTSTVACQRFLRQLSGDETLDDGSTD